jgi:hypothetical protein
MKTIIDFVYWCGPDLLKDNINHLINAGVWLAFSRCLYVLGKKKGLSFLLPWNKRQSVLLLAQARELSNTIDTVRFPGFAACSCNQGRCSKLQCGHRHRQVILCQAINKLQAHVSHIPVSNTLAHQYIRNIKIQVAELLTSIDKYASGISNLDVLAINYQIDELDAFQQRFKDSIIGLEHCLA